MSNAKVPPAERKVRMPGLTVERTSVWICVSGFSADEFIALDNFNRRSDHGLYDALSNLPGVIEVNWDCHFGAHFFFRIDVEVDNEEGHNAITVVLNGALVEACDATEEIDRLAIDRMLTGPGGMGIVKCSPTGRLTGAVTGDLVDTSTWEWSAEAEKVRAEVREDAENKIENKMQAEVASEEDEE